MLRTATLTVLGLRVAYDAALRRFLAASVAGDVADILATVAGRRGLPDGAALRDPRRRGRVGAAHRGPRGSRRALSLAYDRAGAGPVLVLLHPLGADRHVGEPVERLTAERDVIAFDLPGFGDSPPLNGSGPPTPAALAAAVAACLPPGGRGVPVPRRSRRACPPAVRTTSPATRSTAGSRSSWPPPATPAR
jgi:pimeloyl-ACP methyl ester carboxylesterase